MSHPNNSPAPRGIYSPTTPNSNANGSRTTKAHLAPAYPALNHSSGAKWIKNLTQDRLSQFNGGHFADVNLASVLFTRKEDGKDFVKLQTNHWWKVTLTIPEFEQYERVQFGFDPGCEAMIFDTDGLPLQGITGGYGGDRRVEYIIPPAARKANVAHLVIEMSCNGMFRMGGGGIGPPDVEGAEGKDGDKESSSAAVVDGGDGILHIMVMTHWWRLRSLYPAPSSLAPRGGGGG
ncbi:hypothetical protein B0H10DRAFT_2248408 [Mycena sp. CBHHK59/15]|nr:hypothetical protein B0H10DRAFT_2248408 [Mycena sp. CBHHK59/15]